MTLELKKDILSILVVDDDEGMRELFERVFKGESYFIDAVEDGAKAIEKVKAKGYDIAFIDIRMPGISGYTALLEIKKISPSLKAVMITGYSEESTIEACLRDGAYTCLRKPFSLDSLFGIIEKIKSELE